MANTIQNGKGSRPRPVKRGAWDKNYRAIRWNSKRTKGTKQ